MSRKKRPLSLRTIIILLLVFFSLIGSLFFREYLQGEVPIEKQVVVTPIAIAEEGSYLVTKVIDGDTIEIETGERVRYLGIDAHELNTFAGQSAKEYHQSLVLGKKVRLEFDQEKFDDYGRILAYVWLDDILINEKLIKEGYAWVSYLPTKQKPKYLDRLKKAEGKAKSLNKGLWGENG